MCLSALAAGVATSVAQSNVYSLNIVGYVNVPTPIQYSFQTSPLKVTTAVTNGANEIIPNAGERDGDQILVWNGVSWNTYVLSSGQPYGYENTAGNPIPAPILTSGLGYLYNNQQGTAGTITYVGEVRTGTNTLSIPSSPIQAVGSMIPFAGTPITNLQFDNSAGQLDGAEIQKVIRNEPGGSVGGYDVSVFSSGQTTGFETRAGAEKPAPTINAGEGFFFNNGLGTPVIWTQILNP
jgi:hypothetical protein